MMLSICSLTRTNSAGVKLSCRCQHDSYCCRNEQDKDVKDKLIAIDDLHVRLKQSVENVQNLNQQVIARCYGCYSC